MNLLINNEYEVKRVGYKELETDKKGNTIHANEAFPLKIFGEHNMKNLSAAMLVCAELGIDNRQFLTEIADFKGAAKRLELLVENENITIYKDFAHAPSKAQATAQAVRSKYPKAYVKGILELHTYSSLSIEFIENYKGTLDSLDEVLVFFDPHALKLKKLPPLGIEELERIFVHQNLKVTNKSQELLAFLRSAFDGNTEVLLIMSSGNLAGIDLHKELQIS